MQQAIAHRFEKTLHPFDSIDPSHRSVAIAFSMAHLQHSCLLMKQVTRERQSSRTIRGIVAPDCAQTEARMCANPGVGARSIRAHGR